MGKAFQVPSPWIDVCKFRRGGHCVGCSMTKVQKKMFKRLKRPDHQAAFVELLIHQQSDLGKYRHWADAYRRKCRKRGARPAVRGLADAG